MPLGSTYDEVGLLLQDGGWLVLERPDGGRWRLDPSHKAEKLVGQRVRVRGTRSGFDWLSAKTIEAVSGDYSA